MNFEQARHNMIVQQIRPWDVLDERILDTLARVPREHFVAPAYRSLAFVDMEIPLGHGYAMMAPRVEARMLQSLDPRPGDTALEIGTGSGYVSALLGQLVDHVYSVDIHAAFTEAAGARLASHGFDNVTLDTGDAALGWSRRGTFDIIAVTGSLPELPEELKKQLNIGGRIFAVVGNSPAMEARLITRTGEAEWRSEGLFETDLKRLENATTTATFVL